MTFEPETIKDLICLAIVRLGDGATRAAIAKAKICNDTVLGIAIEGMVRDRHVSIESSGALRLSAALATEYRPVEMTNPVTAQVVAAASAKTPSRSEGKMATQICRTCGNEHPLDEEHFNKDSRTPAGFSYVCRPCRGANKKPAAAAKSKPASKANGKAVTAVDGREVYVIPAGGEIACQVIGAGESAIIHMTQDDHRLRLDIGQLQIFRDYADRVLKREFSKQGTQKVAP